MLVRSGSAVSSLYFAYNIYNTNSWWLFERMLFKLENKIPGVSGKKKSQTCFKATPRYQPIFVFLVAHLTTWNVVFKDGQRWLQEGRAHPG